MWPVESTGEGLYASKQDCKVFIGGLSWETTDEKLRRYFENYGSVHEAFVSYDRTTGRPRGFGFVVFDDPAVADRVVSLQHTIDRREVGLPACRPTAEALVRDAGAHSPQLRRWRPRRRCPSSSSPSSPLGSAHPRGPRRYLWVA